MTIRVDQVVSEVVPEPEPSESGESGEERWVAEEKILAALARQERLKRRVAAEGFDD